MAAERARPGLGACVLVLAVAASAAQASCSGSIEVDPAVEESRQCLEASGALYEQRIAPLLATDRPKSCTQCHLSGVDLTLFVREDMCETRACLVEQGLVDLQNPDASLVLTWIGRAEPQSELITEEVIREEYEGFQSFVRQIATCSGAACEGVKCPNMGYEEACEYELEPKDPTLIPKDTPCDSIAMEHAFRNNVYIWRDRCYPCHFTSEPRAALDAPRWIDVRGNCETASITTLHNLEQGGYMNVEDPASSLLLLKPLPLELGGVLHGGDSKFSGTDDETYQSFLSFIEYYAACKTGAATQ
jgi:hypothetical protein